MNVDDTTMGSGFHDDHADAAEATPGRVRALQQQIARTHQRMTEATNRTVDLHVQLDQARAKLRDRDDRLAELQRRLTQLQTAVQQRDDRLAEMERRLGQVVDVARDGRSRPWLVRRLQTYVERTGGGFGGRLYALLDYAVLRWRGGRASTLFARDWYLSGNPDVKASGADPLWHYLRSGFREGRDPHPLFDTDWYARKYPDVASSKRNPLVHYLRHGGFENRNPNPLFDSAWYLAMNPDVQRSGVNPLVHFVETGSRERRDPSTRFSCRGYLESNPEVEREGLCPLEHYLQFRGGAHSSSGETGVIGAAGPAGQLDRRVVIIDSWYPRPDRDSGSIDAINFIRVFASLGYATTFVATAEFSSESTYKHALRDIGVDVVDSRAWPSVDEFLRAKGDRPAIFFLSRVHAGGHYFEHVRAHAPRAKVIFNTVDLHGIRERREAVLRNDRRAVHLSMLTWERELYLSRLADATIVVSAVEAASLREHAPGSNVFEIPLIRELGGRTRPFHERRGVGFVGGFVHPPNVDAVCHFLDDVWPLIHAERPDWTFLVMGSDIPAAIAHRSDPGLKVVGYVPDLSAALGDLRLTVAPLRYGAGAKGKVVSSLSHGVPCVGTSVAFEGMGLMDGEAVLMASSPADFAAQVIRAYEDEALWYRLSERGLELLERRHSIDAGSAHIKRVLGSLGLPVEDARSVDVAVAATPAARVS